MKVLLGAAFYCAVLFSCAAESKVENVALHGRATQSSVLEGAFLQYAHLALPMNAIDGNLNTDFYKGSCVHTTDEINPWLRIDLLQPYKIDSISITTRRDCCPDVMNGGKILVGGSLENNGNNNPQCATVSSMSAGSTVNFPCNEMEGRYVNILMPGFRALMLCEVEVFGRPVNQQHGCGFGHDIDLPVHSHTIKNVALHGRATQSSVLEGAYLQYAHLALPMNAIDGNLNTDFYKGSCVHTADEINPWLRIDLLQPYKIDSISIMTRRDCCPDVMNGGKILVGGSLENNGNNNPQCTTVSSMSAGSTVNFSCNEMEGRYVNILMPGFRALMLCEVEVFGRPVHQQHGCGCTGQGI